MASHKKTAFIREIVRQAQLLSTITDDLADLKNEYLDNGYNSAGSDPIVDSLLANYDITADQFNSVLTMFGELDNFVSNVAVVQGDYAATLNAVRRSPV